MQVLKPEIQQRILARATRSFLAQGFQGTSIRDLAQQVGISSSNLYRYFESKTALYHAVMDDYAADFHAAFSQFLVHDEEGIDADHTAALVAVLSGLIRKDQTKFVILLDRAQGTAHEVIRQRMVEVVATRVRACLHPVVPEAALVTRVIAMNFLAGVLALARSRSGKEALQREIRWLVTYHLGGVAALAEG